MKTECVELLKMWCDSLLEFQITGTKNKRLDGALLCPACQVIHGRCQEMIYPLLCLARHTGEERYKSAALKLFDWGESLVCDDGSFYNDAQSSWNGITVFAAASLWESLVHHGELLDEKTRKRFEQRMHNAGVWIYKTITMDFVTNINYHGAAASVMAMLGIYENKESYRIRAREMAASCLKHITEDGLFYGEGKPMEAVTERGCRPVDMGYNVEESLPALLTYARLLEDREAYDRVKAVLGTHLDFMMPDGGWDNSFGTRNFKWSYWGSRTSDGCLAAYVHLGREEPVYAEAAWRNLQLLKKCTSRGLLSGGPDYAHFGEPSCIHHSFCHAKTLAAVIDGEDVRWERTQLPSEQKRGLEHYPTIDTYRVFTEKLKVTITAYDFEYLKGGHTSGGTISMAWHKDFGVILASSMTIYSLYEAHNMQQVNRKAMHQSLTPEVEYRDTKGTYRQCFDTKAEILGKWKEEKALFFVKGKVRDQNHKEPECLAGYELTYEIEAAAIRIKGRLSGAEPDGFSYILPVAFRHDELILTERDRVTFERGRKRLKVFSITGIRKREAVFNLAGGFEAWKLTVSPDENGRFEIHIYSE